MKSARTNKGFTLLEIMIVVVIIGFLAAIAIPAFLSVRNKAQSTRCVDNLRNISNAKDQWAIENMANSGDSVFQANITPYLKRGFPRCPASGTYTIKPVATDPTCSVGGLHAL